MKEYKYSLLYLEQFILIEYNLLSQRRYVYYQIQNGEIYNYHLVDNQKVIIIHANKDVIKPNNKSVKIIKNYSDRVIKIIQSNKILIVVYMTDSYYVYDLNDVYITNFDYAHYDISWDGKYIVYQKKDVLYRTCVFDLDLVSTLNKFNAKVQVDDCGFLYWITGSNRLVKLVNEINNEFIIVNIETSAKREFTRYWDTKFFDTCNDYLIQQLPESINFYNVTSLTFVKSVEFKIQFVAFHKLLNVFVTNKFDCYYIRSDLELKKITLGQNYLRDRYVYSNRFMNLILDDNLLFSILPDEILHIELYIQLLDLVHIF